MVTEANTKRLEYLMAELQRTSQKKEPDTADLREWYPVVDMDTHKTRWYRKSLYDELQKLRFTTKWHDEM